MSAIPISGRFFLQRAPSAKRTPSNDVVAGIRSWSRHTKFWGAVFGFMFGAILVATRLATDVLSFGVFGTLVIAVTECAVIAAGFAALAAALSGKTREDNTQPAATPSSEIRPESSPYVLQGPDEDWGTASSLQNRLETIDAWENGNTGP